MTAGPHASISPLNSAKIQNSLHLLSGHQAVGGGKAAVA